MLRSKGKFIGDRGHKYDSVEEFHANELSPEVIMQKPGVVSAMAGTKIKNGIDTGIPCIVVGVKKKLPKNKLSSKDLVPSNLPDNVITDVIEIEEIFSMPAPYTDKHRPLLGGISAIRVGGTACTLGAIVKDSTDGKLVALTNNHCCGIKYDPEYYDPLNGNINPEGDNYLQPSPYDGGTEPSSVVGTVKRCVSMKFGGINYVDAAIASINFPIEEETNILDFAPGPFEFGSKDDYEIGEIVDKIGRTTGHTTFTVTSKNVNVNVNYGCAIASISNTIQCEGALVVNGGDSGSALLLTYGDTYKIIGLMFAASGDSPGFAIPIEDIASELQVEAWDGKIVVAENDSALIEVNDKSYTRIGNTIAAEDHIADLVILNFTGDATILSSEYSFKSDSNLKIENISDTFTSDSSIVGTTEQAFTSDSSLNINISSTFNSLSNLKLTVSDSFSSDASITGVIENTFTSDSNIKDNILSDFTSDSYLIVETVFEFLSDSNLKKTLQYSYSSDSSLKSVLFSSFTGDSKLLETISSTITSDASLLKVISATFTSDASITISDVDSFTGDASIKLVSTSTFTGDANISGYNLLGTYTGDASLVGTLSTSFTGDSYIKDEDRNSIYIECVFKMPSGVLDDPYEPAYVIKDAKGTTHASGGLLKRDTGQWYTYWTPTQLGDFVCTMSGKIRGYQVKIKRKLKVTNIEVKLTY